MNNIFSKEFIEILIAKAISFKEDIRLLNTKGLTMNEQDINNIMNECDYLIAGMHSFLNPDNKKIQFDKKMDDEEFLKYAKKYIESLEEDLTDIRYSLIFAG